MPAPPHLPDESLRRHPTRRVILGLGTLAAAAGVARLWPHREHLPPPPSGTPPPPPLPAETFAYRDFLADHPLRHLSPEEIIRPHLKTRSGIPCGLPPREHWTRLLPTLHAADELRERLGVPLQLIVSAYRSPAYNAKCPGAVRWSQHTRNRALDLVFDCPAEEAFAAALTLREEGFFTGGLGLYQSFLHLDTRSRNATWGA
jgi:hypothetical protein